MNWTFLKANWFSIALVLLIVAAISRKQFKLPFVSPEAHSSEFMQITAGSRESQTALGIATDRAETRSGPAEIDQEVSRAFLKRFAGVATSERKKFGVPASILLAIAFLNSNAGASEASREANNFFDLPCSGDWEGESTTIDGSCLRQYETPWASWRDFSIYLTSQDWFGSVKKTAGKDWKLWAKGLQGKPISSVSNLSKKISEVVEYYHLEELDR